MTKLISIHAPLAGCDDKLSTQMPFFKISIHAPLAGCDDMGAAAIRAQLKFQSTHPLRGATPFPRDKLGEHVISIHAPLAGCDAKDERAELIKPYFNPRTPCGVRPC